MSSGGNPRGTRGAAGSRPVPDPHPTQSKPVESVPAPNSRSVSTRVVWKVDKISEAAGGPQGESPEASARRLLRPTSHRNPVTMTVTYRGGSEAWFEIKARGCTWRTPGHVWLLELMLDICRES